MSDKPNFIVFMSDDHGHRDLSCMGATDFQTPNFDRIASRGARLTRWYSNAPICSAGRCGILNGTLCPLVSLATTHDRHAHRHGRRHRQNPRQTRAIGPL